MGENRHNFSDLRRVGVYEPCSALLTKIKSCVLGQHTWPVVLVEIKLYYNNYVSRTVVHVYVHTVATCVPMADC